MIWKMATDRVLIQREVRPQTTAGGIVVPDRVREKAVRGTVLAAGPNATGVMPGDVAMFDPKYAVEVEKDIFSIDATGVLALQRAE